MNGSADDYLRAAMSAWGEGKHELVGRYLRQAVALAPRSPRVHEALSQWHMEEGRFGPAMQDIQTAASLAPGNVSIRISRAFLLANSGDAKGAWELIEPLLAEGAFRGRAVLLYGRIAEQLGQREQALESVRRVLNPPGPVVPEAATLHFAAASLPDDRGRYDEAFQRLQKAHQLAGRGYDPESTTRLYVGLMAYFDERRFRALPRATHGNRRPVFIVVMPRSGTSLVEQILASHPSIFGAGELKTLARIAVGLEKAPWAGGTPFPACMELLSIRSANELAGQYLSVIDEMNASVTYVTDKMPVSFRDLWLVQVLFPDSRAIHRVRDVRETCLSCYVRDFVNGNQFTHDMQSLAAFYRDYQRLTGHWHRVLDLPILDVTYEAVVDDLEREARRCIQFLDLPWDDRCLRYYSNPPYVGTASKQQVRRPIYRSSVGRWRNYEAHLAPLLAALDTSR